MLGFTSKAFRTGFAIALWLILIVCVVAGALIVAEDEIAIYKNDLEWASYMRRKPMSIGPVILKGFAGAVGGGVAGLLFVILCGGFVANFLEMKKNLEFIKKNVDKS